MTQKNTIDINIEFTFDDVKYKTKLIASDAEDDDLEFLTKEINETLGFAETFNVHKADTGARTIRARYLYEDILQKIVEEINAGAFQFDVTTYKIIRNVPPALDQDLFKDENGEFDKMAFCKYFNKNLTRVYVYISTSNTMFDSNIFDITYFIVI